MLLKILVIWILFVLGLRFFRRLTGTVMPPPAKKQGQPESAEYEILEEDDSGDTT